jgi:hypothetical protein
VWGDLLDEPIFVLTADQDWAPSWTMEDELAIAARHDVPLHLFVTNDDPLVRRPPAGLTLGIHPNFGLGSTHGDTPAAVVDHCLGLVPGATTARTHGFTESTSWLAELARRGVSADSNVCTVLQPGLAPLLHISGMVRIPIFLADDVLLHWSGRVPELAELKPLLSTPGLKVLSFHPGLVGINASSVADYEAARPHLYRGAPGGGFDHGARGIGDLLDDVLEYVRQTEATVLGFPDLVERVRTATMRAFPDGILGWTAGRAWGDDAGSAGLGRA